MFSQKRILKNIEPIFSFKRAQIIVIVLGSLIMTQSVHAALNINVNPFGGGSSLRFGREGLSGEMNKEVRIRVTSNDNKQYQIFQRLIEPLTNERGEKADMNALKAYSLFGSNSSGTLYLDNISNVSYAKQLIYSSSPSGESNSFTVVYAVDPAALRGTGDFFGKIVYTVQSFGGSAQKDVYLNVTVASYGRLNVDIQGPTADNTIRLDSGDTTGKDGHVEISLSGNTGGSVRIYQLVERLPQNEFFEELDKEMVQFVISGGMDEHVRFQSLTPLEVGKNMVYASRENEDSFSVDFALDESKSENHKAGIYEGKIIYFVETGRSQEEHVFDIKVEINPVFNLEVELPPGGVNFSNILPDSPPQISEVIVSVKTNLGKPYMVVQDVSTPLTNRKGDVIPGVHFTLKGELQEGRGRIAFPDFKTVSYEDTTIFYSDKKGSSASFKIFYRLSSFPKMVAGDYSTSIVYSLGEM